MRKLNQQERVIEFIKFLRQSTDESHKIKPEDIKKAFKAKGMNIGSPNTLHAFVISLANAMNLDENERLLPKEEWRVVFDDYAQDKEDWHIKNLYFNPEFSHDDIDAMVEAIRFSRTMEPERAERLINTLENNFASKYYKQSSRHICKVYESSMESKMDLKEKLNTIQEAIDAGLQIEYRFNGYTRDKKLAPAKDYVRMASPYYLISDNGKYYLLAANDKYKEAYIVRVDLMSDVRIAKEKGKKSGIKRLSKNSVKNLPKSWDPEYLKTHYQMSYDNPQWITLKVLSKKDENGNPIDPDYTFIHDAFGENYLFQGVDKKDPNYDIVMIKCSPFGMFNFAMQYSNRVEVLEPKTLRENIKTRVKELSKKYGK